MATPLNWESIPDKAVDKKKYKFDSAKRQVTAQMQQAAALVHTDFSRIDVVV